MPKELGNTIFSNDLGYSIVNSIISMPPVEFFDANYLISNINQRLQHKQEFIN